MYLLSSVAPDEEKSEKHHKLQFFHEWLVETITNKTSKPCMLPLGQFLVFENPNLIF